MLKIRFNMKNRIIKILIGIPASGKSTFAKEFVLNNSNWVRVCRDEFRYALKNQQVCEPKIEDLITKLVVDTTRSALNKNLNVILDATHVREKYINAIVEEFKYEADIDYQLFDISLNKAIERDATREKKVGPEVIKKMYESYKVLVDSFHFQPHKKLRNRPVIKPNFESELPDAVIFDIDGTLAIMGNRSPFEWDKVDRDSLNEIVSDQLKFHYEAGRTIILLSGRDESCRKLTEEWLEYYNIPWHLFYMRPAGSYEKDTIIKRNIYYNQIKDRYNVLAVYDDRLSVVKDTWFDLGLFTFCCNQGLVEF